jgi:formylglycine-generating enzyme required for sulfatase activity
LAHWPADSLPLAEIPAGRFLMGSPYGLPFAPEGPVHEVVISRAFRMARTPVTSEQYSELMGGISNGGIPATDVSWLDAREFCRRLSESNRFEVRLPTEAEWEYACRAGGLTEFHFGDGAKELGDYAWFEDNSGGKPAVVGQKKPNAWGLYDMIGNVWEWCEDVWHETYQGAPCDGSAWLTGVAGERRRAVRGAAWDMDTFRCRSSYRSFDWEDAPTSRSGFRIVVQDKIEA